jgi:hypothetical protein
LATASRSVRITAGQSVDVVANLSFAVEEAEIGTLSGPSNWG